MKSHTAEKQFLTTGDVAEITGMTIQKIRSLCETGRLPAVDTSTAKRVRWTIRRVDLEAFLTPASVAKSQTRKQSAARRRAIDADVPKVFG